MNLAGWGAAAGIDRLTAYRWFGEGELPVRLWKVCRLILVAADAALAASTGGVGLYARVSSHDLRAVLDRQTARLRQWAAAAGHRVVRAQAEVGSGMNGARAKARRLLADPQVTVLVVEHRDRLGG